MRARMGLLTTALILIPLGGCSVFRGSLSPDGDNALGLANTYLYDKKFADDARYYLRAYNAAGASQRTVRDAIIYELMGRIDNDYERYAQSVRKDRDSKNLAQKMLSLGLTGAASLAAGSAANVLAAVDTGFKGASDAVDSTVFLNYATEILINEMDSDRALAAQDIYTNLKNKDVSSYTLQEAVRDLEGYYYKGTVTRALTALAASTAKESKDNSKAAASIKAGS